MIYQASREKVVTRRIGGLSAILHEEVQIAIWSRRIGREASAELLDVAGQSGVDLDFLTLTDDPRDRIDHQLRRANIQSAFLAHDIALLVTVYNELSKSRKIRVRLGGSVSAWGDDGDAGDLRLCCTYLGEGLRPGRSEIISLRPGNTRRTVNGQVAVFRRGLPAPGFDGVRGVRPGLQLWLDRAD